LNKDKQGEVVVYRRKKRDKRVRRSGKKEGVFEGGKNRTKGNK
jgi:hypothetical protein